MLYLHFSIDKVQYTNRGMYQVSTEATTIYGHINRLRTRLERQTFGIEGKRFEMISTEHVRWWFLLREYII